MRLWKLVLSYIIFIIFLYYIMLYFYISQSFTDHPSWSSNNSQGRNTFSSSFFFFLASSLQCSKFNFNTRGYFCKNHGESKVRVGRELPADSRIARGFTESIRLASSERFLTFQRKRIQLDFRRPHSTHSVSTVMLFIY